MECDRVLHRAAARGDLTEAVVADRRAHLASVLLARSAVAGLELLSLDARIRTVGKKLGLTLLPRDLEPAPGRAAS